MSFQEPEEIMNELRRVVDSVGEEQFIVLIASLYDKDFVFPPSADSEKLMPIYTAFTKFMVSKLGIIRALHSFTEAAHAIHTGETVKKQCHSCGKELNGWPDLFCGDCAAAACPHGSRDHMEKDGCPSCYAASRKASMAFQDAQSAVIGAAQALVEKLTEGGPVDGEDKRDIAARRRREAAEENRRR